MNPLAAKGKPDHFNSRCKDNQWQHYRHWEYLQWVRKGFGGGTRFTVRLTHRPTLHIVKVQFDKAKAAMHFKSIGVGYLQLQVYF